MDVAAEGAAFTACARACRLAPPVPAQGDDFLRPWLHIMGHRLATFLLGRPAERAGQGLGLGYLERGSPNALIDGMPTMESGPSGQRGGGRGEFKAPAPPPAA